MWYMIKIGIAVLLFAAPAIYIVRREWILKKAQEGKPRGDSMTFSSFVKVTLVLLPMTAFLFLASFSTYSFYSPKDSALKVAFKHTGKRMVDCDESELIRKEGERYRQQLKQTKQVSMNIAKLAKCPRERFPVAVELTIDGKKILDKAYSPTGLKKDMASYIYEEFLITPGEHKLTVKLYDSGHKNAPDFVYEDSFDVKARGIKLIRFDDKANRLVLE